MMETTKGKATITFLMQRILISTILHLLSHTLNLEISSEYHNNPFCCECPGTSSLSSSPYYLTGNTLSSAEKNKASPGVRKPFSQSQRKPGRLYPVIAQGKFTHVIFVSHGTGEIEPCARRCREGMDRWVCPHVEQAGILSAWESCP